MTAVTHSVDSGNVLLVLGAGPPLAWPGAVVEADAAGPLCTERPGALTLWAPAGAWVDAFRLLAMCKSAAPESCLVLTDVLAPLEHVPEDGRVATVVDGRPGPVHAGCAAFACRDFRGERIFRWMLSGRVRRRPHLARLLRLHRLAATAHGRCVLDRWESVIPVLFTSGLPGMMPEDLQRDLGELAEAASLAERAFTGGFHLLDPVVRGPADWEAGARTYLPVAAAQSPGAQLAVQRWLAATSGWANQPPAVQQRNRLATARMLHRLVDDPWLPGDGLADPAPRGCGPA